jgi:thioredoxin 1
VECEKVKTMADETDEELRKIRMKKMQEMQESAQKKAEGLEWPDRPVRITDMDFKSTIKGYPLVVIDFWAPWCGPCRIVGPIIDELSKEYKGRVVFAKMNVDQNPIIASTMHVMGIPTLMIFKDGNIVQRVSGALPKKYMKQMIDKYLG